MGVHSLRISLHSFRKPQSLSFVFRASSESQLGAARMS